MNGVLLVEDEAGLRTLMRDQLQDNGLHVTVAGTVQEAQAALGRVSFSVVILDVTLPDGSGLDILEQLRASRSTSHVIIVSGLAAEADRVRALQSGADDFVAKPFFVRELTERVLAVGRRNGPIEDTPVTLGHLEVDLCSRQVTAGGTPIELTAKEFDLLAYLAVRPGHVFDREQLLNAVWQSASEWQQAATVTEHIRRLRAKLELDPSNPTLLRTVRGSGYRLDLQEVEAGFGPSPVGEELEPGDIVHVDGVIVSCDQAIVDLLGATAADAVVGRHVTDFVAPSSLAAASERLVATRGGTARRSELIELRRGDAGRVTAAVDAVPTMWGDSRPAWRVRVTPITDASAQPWRMAMGVFGDLTDAVIITDLHFHIRSWNTAAERLYGWTECEVSGRHILDILCWVDGIPEIWQRLENTGGWHGESTQVARDGSVVEVLSSTTLMRDEAGDAVGIVWVNRSAIDTRPEKAIELDATFASRLRRGLAADEFVVHFQPVVDLADARLVTLEALVRWEHPERGTLLPGEFMGTAERAGSIVQLGELVLAQASRQAAAWRRAGADINLSVNVSGRQLADAAMAERFIDILQDAGLDPSSLCLEVTETSLVRNLDTANQVLRRLVDLGVRVAIDDFGTGWGSLTYLRELPVHGLKIDKSFVAGVGRHASDTAIVKSILSLADDLGLFVVAEGVETQAQRDALQALGCRFGQGYLLGHPTPAHDVPIEHADWPMAADRRTGDAAAAAMLGTTSPSAATTVTSGIHPSGVAVLDVASAPRERSCPAPKRLGHVESDIVANLLRGLLRVRSAPGASTLLQQTILGMGGTPVPAHEASQEALPVDVSLGEGPPMLVEVEPFTVARMQLERLLPRLVEDAQQAVHLLRQRERLHPGPLIRPA